MVDYSAAWQDIRPEKMGRVEIPVVRHDNLLPIRLLPLADRRVFDWIRLEVQ